MAQIERHNPLDRSATAHTRVRYDRMAPIYDTMEGLVEAAQYCKWRTMLWSQVAGPQVLELGVGTGKNIPHYPAGATVTAIDISGRMLARAKRAAAQHPDAALDLSLMDAQQLAFAEQTFDAVVGTFVFCSVPDPVLGLRQALRMAKPGSRLLLLEHMRAKQAVVGQAMQALDPAVHWLTGVHIARRTVQNVRAAGWQIESVTPLSPGDIFRMIEARRS